MSALIGRDERAGQLDAVALDGAEAGQRERHRVGAGPQVDDAVLARAVGHGRRGFSRSARAGGFDRHAGQHRAGRVLDHACNRRLRERKRRQQRRGTRSPFLRFFNESAATLALLTDSAASRIVTPPLLTDQAESIQRTPGIRHQQVKEVRQIDMFKKLTGFLETVRKMLGVQDEEARRTFATPPLRIRRSGFLVFGLDFVLFGLTS